MNKMQAQKSFNTAQKAFHLSSMKVHENMKNTEVIIIKMCSTFCLTVKFLN